MSSQAKRIDDDFPPGFNFVPTDEELIELYLLRRVRGQPDAHPGLIIEDDTAANTQPWELFRRHGLSDELPAFFYVHTNNAARPDRGCRGGGSWKSQKSNCDKELHVRGEMEKTKWSRHNLNLNMGSGSVGWVMHEYSIVTDHPSSLKLYCISFTGHGQKRKRVPDGYDEPATQRPRVAEYDSAGSSASASSTSFDSAEEIEAMIAELSNAQPIQEQVVQTMEQPGTAQLPSAPCISSTLSQDAGPANDHCAVLDQFELPPDEILDQFFLQFNEQDPERSMDQVMPADGEPYQYQQQLDKQVPMEQMVDQEDVVMPSICGDGEPFLQFNKQDSERSMDQVMPADGEPYQYQQQFDKQVPMEQMVNQEDVCVSSFCGAQDKDVLTATQDGVEWEGFFFS